MWRNPIGSIGLRFSGLLLVVCLGASACGDSVLGPRSSDRDSGHLWDSAVDTGNADAIVGDSGDGSGPDGSPPDGALTPDQGPSPDGTPAPLAYDVVVVGAGTGGVAAAIQAARLGSKVALVEETDWIGGQSTAAGVTQLDGVSFGQAKRNGFVAEFVARITDHYNKLTPYPKSKAGLCDPSVCFEPSAAQLVLRQMLDQAGVTLYLRASVTKALRSANTVTGIVLANNQQLDCDVLVDATEHGDIIPLTGARYRVGNSTSDAVNQNACIQDLTYVAVIKKYPGGVPTALQIHAEPPGYEATVQRFRSHVTKNGASGGWPANSMNWPYHNRYRAMPDADNPYDYARKVQTDWPKITKTTVNFANDYPGSRIDRSGSKPVPVHFGQLKVSYLENPTVRRDIDCKAKLLTLNFLYYMQHELGESKWSVADEGYDTPYNIQDNDCPGIPAKLKPLERQLNVMPYVRESRRIVPIRTLTAKDIYRDPQTKRAVKNFPTAIAIGHYATDLHNCNQESDFDLGDTKAEYQEWRAGAVVGPFQVPFEAMIPKSIDGLIAAEKNIGVSRVASAATRLHPITMLTGQAAGIIAALAVKTGKRPRDLRPIDVQWELTRTKSAISLFDYADVPRSHPLWQGVQFAAAYEMMQKSASNFGVDDPLTRDQAAVVLARLFDLDVNAPPATPTFKADVPTNHWAHAHIEALYDAGITSGCGKDQQQQLKYCPDAATTRAQLAVFVAKALGLNPNGAAVQELFKDVPDNPNATMTRGHAAAIVSRVLRRTE